MTDLTFAIPAWLWGGLLIVPLFALRLWARWYARKKIPGLVSPKLMGQLVNGSSRPQRWVVFSLRMLALLALLVALARPQLGYEEVETQTDSRNLIIAIDTSRSMLADDLAPNRLSRAMLAANDIVRALPEDRIGLMAFAGRPFLQAPLTVDHEAVLEAINQLDTEVIPRGGTNLTAAAELALETFKEANLNQSTLVLFSDGEALEGGEELEGVRLRAGEAGMTIITVGVGTREGSLIPELDQQGDPVPGVFLKDNEGQVVRSRLETGAIRELAGKDGLYVHLGGKTSLSRVVSEIQKGITTTREEGESRLRPIERFMWPLGASFLLLVLSHFVPSLWLKPRQTRPGFAPVAARGLVAALILLSPDLNAKDAVMQGHESYLEGNYDEAIRTYEGALSEKNSKRDHPYLQMGLGAATFRTGNYERAAEAYGQALVDSSDSIRELAHYNLGNTLFEQGASGLTNLQSTANPDTLQSLSSPNDQRENTIRQWEGAIEHYESALSLNANNKQAAHNLETVKKKLEELKNQQEEQQQEEQQQQDQQQGDSDQQDKNQDQKQQDQKQSQQEEEEPQNEQEQSQQEEEDQRDPNEDGQNGEQQPDDNSGENEQEQPEDPGGDEEQNQDNKDPQQDDSQVSQDPPEQPEAPQEGDLGAQPDQPQNAQPQQARMNPEDLEQNPQTGYSPSEARQLLEALADETEVRPVLMPSGNENYKNW